MWTGRRANEFGGCLVVCRNGVRHPGRTVWVGIRQVQTVSGGGLVNGDAGAGLTLRNLKVSVGYQSRLEGSQVRRWISVNSYIPPPTLSKRMALALGLDKRH